MPSLTSDMKKCRRFQHCPVSKAERDQKAPDMAVIDTSRCYHRSLDITAAEARTTHPAVAEQLWPGSRLACRATSLCTPSGRRLADDLRLACSRASELTAGGGKTQRDNSSSSYANSSSPAPPPNGAAWRGLAAPLGTGATPCGTVEREPSSFFPAAGWFWLFLTMETVLDEFSLTRGWEEKGCDAAREASRGEPAPQESLHSGRAWDRKHVLVQVTE